MKTSEQEIDKEIYEAIESLYNLHAKLRSETDMQQLLMTTAIYQAKSAHLLALAQLKANYKQSE